MKPVKGAIRYEAEWVTKQHCDADGEWNPDRDEYSTSHHSTKESAEHAAIKGSQQSGHEWILVAEQKYSGREWVDQQRWTGDWEGLHDQTLAREA